MSKLLRICILFSLASVCFSLHGRKSLVDQQIDSLSRSSKVVFIDGRPSDVQAARDVDSIRQKVAAFYYDQFRHFQDPQAPYFLFMSKDAGLAMGIGGCVRMRGYFDWGGAIPAPGFAPYLIPMVSNPAAQRQLGTTPAGTSLFFRVIGRNKLLGEYQVYIEANFNGYQSRDFHLKKAYAVMNDFTVGYAPSTFSDPSAQQPIVDAQGANNKISPTSVLIRYMPTIKDKWVFAVSVETPAEEKFTGGTQVSKVTQWLPDFAAFMQYQWDRGQHIRLAGIVRNLPYRDNISASNYNVTGWGLLLSHVGHPVPAVTTYASVNYGQGYAGLGGDLLIGNYDLIGIAGKPGRMKAPTSYGWNVALQYNFRPNLFVSAGVSQSRYLPGEEVDDDEYQYGIMSCANIFWNPTPRIQLGGEFDWGLRHNFDGKSRAARRVGAMIQFSF